MIVLLAGIVAGGASTTSAQASGSPLHPGDRVFVRVGSDSVWSDSLTVDTDGQLYVPRVGAVTLRGIAAEAVPARVRTALEAVYRVADATVVPLRRVTVLGEVRKGGVFYLPLESTVRDALAVGQGTTEIGNPDRVTLIRDGVSTRLVHWSTGADGAQLVQSGDALIVARDSWIKRNALAAVSTLAILVTTFVAVHR